MPVATIDEFGKNKIKRSHNVNDVIEPQGPLVATRYDITMRNVYKCKEHTKSPHQQETPAKAGHIVCSPGLNNLRNNTNRENNIANPTQNIKKHAIVF